MSSTMREIEAAAREAESSRNWEKACGLWESRLSIEPSTPDLWVNLARSALQAGRLDRAREALDRASKDGAAGGRIAMLQAEICERGQDYAGAFQWWKEAVDSMPDSYWARYGLARSMKRLETYSFDEIINEMRPALRLPDAETRGTLFTADLLFKTGDLEAAEEMISRCILDVDEREMWAINAMPGMTSPKERKAARELARNLQGPGKIVDLGCWLGSLSAALASGLEASTNAAKPSKIIAYDRFLWSSSYMESNWPGSHFGVKERDDFLPWFKVLARKWEKWIDVRKSDLSQAQWDEGAISLLVVDAMKTEDIAVAIMKAFYPSLLPGAFVFHQDYCHDFTWWIHLYQYRLRERFRVADTVDGTGTVVFQLLEPIGQSTLDDLLATDLADPTLAADAFEYSLSIVNPVDHRKILGAYLNCERTNDRPENAARIQERLKSLS